MDEEIQQLMEELIMRRTKEKDYQSLEDQIRCLRQRFQNLEHDQGDLSREQKQKEQLKEQRINNLAQEVDDAHQQRLADQAEYADLKGEYIHLNEALGDREQELANLRGECTQQLGFNKEMERQVAQLDAENGRLRAHIRDCKAEQQRTRQMAETLARSAAEKQETLNRIDDSMLRIEDEIKVKERQAQQLDVDIAERQATLEKAKESAAELEAIILDLKATIDKLKLEEQELTRTLEALNVELRELEQRRQQVSKENEILKGHAAQFDQERVNSENENTRCLQEKDRILDQQNELMRRLEELRETQRSLELKQKNVEAQLEEFVQENERIRMQILQRDRLAQELRDKARITIEQSAYQVRQSSPLRGADQTQ